MFVSVLFSQYWEDKLWCVYFHLKCSILNDNAETNVGEH